LSFWHSALINDISIILSAECIVIEDRMVLFFQITSQYFGRGADFVCGLGFHYHFDFSMLVEQDRIMKSCLLLLLQGVKYYNKLIDYNVCCALQVMS
jgi:hypothetical protein